MRYPVLPLAFASFLTLTVTSCTAVFSDVYATWDYATQQQDDATLSAEEVEAFPYTAVYVRRGQSPRALVVLGYIDGQDEFVNYSWVTADAETLVTRHGRLIKTSEIEPELIGRSNLTADPLRCIQRQLARSGFTSSNTECEVQWRSELDLEEQGKPYSIEVTSEFSMDAVERLSLPFGEVSAIRVTETQTFASSEVGPQQRQENVFWLEADGHVVKSIQYFAPKQSPVEISQVKWVGRSYE